MQVSSHLEENGIEVREYDEVSSDVALLAANKFSPSSATDITENGINEAEENTCGFVWVDPGSCCYALYPKLNSDKVLLQQSPLALAKAIKVAYPFFLQLDILLWNDLYQVLECLGKANITGLMNPCDLFNHENVFVEKKYSVFVEKSIISTSEMRYFFVISIRKIQNCQEVFPRREHTSL